MNSKRYNGVNYPTREVTDLKDLVNSSTSMFPDNTAYLTKDKKAAAFVPITYRKVKEDLDALGLLVKVVPHTHAVGTHDRCHTTVEPMIKPQWFVHMKEMAQASMEASFRIPTYSVGPRKR